MMIVSVVYMNGSRTNKNIKKDIFQDYNLFMRIKTGSIFLVIDYRCNVLMKLIILLGFNVDFDKEYGWLIQFKDGKCLDLHIKSLTQVNILADKLCLVLLDKDHLLPIIIKPSDEDYWIKSLLKIFKNVCIKRDL